ncbi:MAG: hypothetical protein AAGC46_15405, partial [Solirubrobacteraceae bacterium]|nr:hypothetical protein [Patulibacter sp.]
MPHLARLSTSAAVALVLLAATATTASAACQAGDNTYTGTSTGQWNDNLNWSAGHFPTTSENVCVPAGKTVLVLENGIANAAKVTIAAGAKVTMRTDPGFSDTQASWGDTDLAGTLEFTATGTPGNDHDGNGFVIRKGATLTNSGTLNVAQVEGTTVIDGDVTTTAAGTTTISGALNLQGSGRSSGERVAFTNAGQVTVTSTGSITPNAAFGVGITQTAGTFTDNGDVTFGNPSDRLTVTGGTFTGTAVPTFRQGQIAVSGGSGTVGLNFGNAQLVGDVGANWTVRIQDRGSDTTRLNVPADVTNAGTIRFAKDPSTDPSNRVATQLTVAGGATLTNTGLITDETGIQTSNLAGDITNTAAGTISFSHAVQILWPGSPAGVGPTWKNAGQVTIGATGSLATNATWGFAYRQTAGTLTANGTFTEGNPGDLFAVSGGTVTGSTPPDLNRAALALTGGTGTVRIHFAQDATLATDVAAGWTIRIEDRSSNVSGLAIPAGTTRTNAGTILLTKDPSTDPTNRTGVQLEVRAGAKLINTGTIRAEAGVIGSESIIVDQVDGDGVGDPAAFVQNGTLDVAHDLTLPPHTQRGTTILAANTRTTVGNTGNTHDPGLTLAAGTIRGSGTILARHVVNTGGTVDPTPGAATRLTFGARDIYDTDWIGGTASQPVGDYVQRAGGTLKTTLGASNAGLAVGGAITLGGTWTLATASGYTPPAGQTYPVARSFVRDAPRSGTFATLPSGSAPTYEADGADYTVPSATGAQAFSIDDLSTVEGSEYTFTVHRSAPATGAATVHWTLRPTGSATENEDFPNVVGGFHVAGDVSFAAGETAKTVSS